MRIGVDGTCWANGRGYGRFIRHLLPAMVRQAPEDEFIFFLDSASAQALDLDGPNLHRVVVPLGQAATAAARSDGYRSPVDMLRLTRAVWQHRPDVMFFPTVYSFFPLVPGQRAVVTIHDAIAERFPDLTLPSKRAQLFWRLKVRLALRQCSVVLTVSDYAAHEVEEVLGVSAERIRVATEAPAGAFRPSDDPAMVRRLASRAGVPDGKRWFIYVGGFNPHKHVDAIVRALAIVARDRGPAAPHLLLVGTIDQDVFHGSQAAIRRAITAEGAENLVHWTGFVPDEELGHLYSGAVAVVLPSASEGFGLPAVEAAACGTPAVATTASPLPQLLAGGGIFIPPGDVPAIATAMRALLDDEPARQAMGREGYRRSTLLSWAEAANTALAALREATSQTR